MGKSEIEASSLTHSAVQENVAASTQNQARNAILFLYRNVLQQDLGWLGDVTRAKQSARLPVVLTQAEVQSVLTRLDGQYWVMASPLYGSGLRLMECLRLRVKDLEFTSRELVVRDGKGAKDRLTMLPEKLIPPLQRQLERVRAVHQQDLQEGFGAVYLPDDFQGWRCIATRLRLTKRRIESR